MLFIIYFLSSFSITILTSQYVVLIPLYTFGLHMPYRILMWMIGELYVSLYFISLGLSAFRASFVQRFSILLPSSEYTYAFTRSITYCEYCRG